MQSARLQTGSRGYGDELDRGRGSLQGLYSLEGDIDVKQRSH